VNEGRAHFERADYFAASLLALVIVVVFCAAYDRTTVEAWQTPIWYRGDVLFLLSYLKAARDGHVIPGGSLFVPELNAPFGANWNDHPRTLRPLFLLGGLLARWLGLFATLNLMLLVAHVLAGLALFFVARYFRARREWALAVGLAFGLSHFLFWRTLDHLDLAFCWHIPLCVMVVTWAFTRRGIAGPSKRLAVALAITVVTAFHNPYYSALFAQFLLLGALAQFLRGERRKTAAPVLLVGVLAAFFLLDHAGTLAFELRHGSSPGASRAYGGLERYALKPLELFVPPLGFGLADWGRLAREHWQHRLYRGEGGSQYLGLVGAATLVWLGALALARSLRRPPKAPPPSVLAVAWILAYSVIGGLNQVLGLFGFFWLRGTNRFSVWILALVLLYLATRRVRPRTLSLALAALAAVLCVADQVLMYGNREPFRLTRQAVDADRSFMAGVESTLPAGAMVFQLPVIEFPEGQPLPGIGEYEPLRPYLLSDRLRFSFGSDKGRRREAWQAAVAAQPPAALVATLEACGFSGLLVDRRAYGGDDGELLAELAASGHPVRARSAAGDFAFVKLQPRRPPPRPGPEEGLGDADRPGAWGGAACADAIAATAPAPPG
jgi:hypothetical protein